MSKKLKTISICTEDVLEALEPYDYKLVGELRAKIKDGVITIKRRDYKIKLTFEETEEL